jgi:superoxide dismutase, Fe-Mn family
MEHPNHGQLTRPTVEHAPISEGGLNRRDFLKLAGTGLGTMLLGGRILSQEAKAIKSQTYTEGLTLSHKDTLSLAVAKDFRTPLGKGFPGLSAKQVEAHIKLYEGYVKKHATITQELSTLKGATLEGANATYHPYRELLVEQSFALNGALLHEYYFENLSATPQTPSSLVSSTLATAFGSMESFKGQLMAAAKSMRGWAILGYCMWDGNYHLYGLDAHNTYSPMGILPLLVIDVYEHAYMVDYSTDRAAYLNAIWPYIHWGIVEQRLAMVKGH